MLGAQTSEPHHNQEGPSRILFQTILLRDGDNIIVIIINIIIVMMIYTIIVPRLHATAAGAS